jgi:type IV pilus assembly protein PilY1
VDAKKGWYLGLVSTEQVVTSAITVFGVTTFSTHQPAVPVVGSCSNNLGTTHVYNISYSNAASANGTGLRYENVIGGGLPPSPVAGMVTLDDGTTVPFIIGSKAASPLEGSPPSSPLSAVQPKSRVYWYIQQ